MILVFSAAWQGKSTRDCGLVGPERVRDGHEALEVDAGQVPHYEGVDRVQQEAVHPTHLQQTGSTVLR